MIHVSEKFINISQVVTSALKVIPIILVVALALIFIKNDAVQSTHGFTNGKFSASKMFIALPAVL